MSKWTFILIVILVASCTTSSPSPTATSVPPTNTLPQPTEARLDELVDVGTHRLHIYCTGTGRPTIVIDTGLGETYQTSWASNIESLSRETRVCSYDRAGYGQSEPGPMPRDSQRSADELHLLLVNSGEDGPFLLVGHSLGALNIQVYADSYPEEVTGLVLLDPAPLGILMGEKFPEIREGAIQDVIALREEADAASASSNPIAAGAPYLNAIASEGEQLLGQSLEQVAAIDSFGELPLTVIGATEPDPDTEENAEAIRQYWNDELRILAGKSGSGQFILAEGSGHHIHWDAPQLVIDVILEMIR